MTDMHCNSCRELLHGYLDNELDTATASRVAAHLADCDDCNRRYAEIKMLMAGVKDHAAYYEAPVALTRQIFSGLHAPASPTENMWKKMRSALQHGLMPAFSAAALAAALLLYVAAPSGEDAWMDEAVSDHVRSLMAGHLNDVASSDRHTVKPWFAGKLDFSPPVYDFSVQGYPLLGGRMDYLQHQTTAALAYGRNKHIINLFVLPAAEADHTAQSLSKRGYNIVSWRQSHMRFIAVSDLNKIELEAFSQLVQKGM